MSGPDVTSGTGITNACVVTNGNSANNGNDANMEENAQTERGAMSDSQEQFNHNDFQVVAREQCFKGFYSIQKYHVKHRLFAGGWSNVLQRELFVRHNATCVLLFDPVRNKVVLVEQFRIGAIREAKTPWLLELVAGLNGEGESPEDVARREAVEEAGCELKALMHISSYLPSPGGSSEKVDLYCALVDSEGVGGLHGLENEGEDIRVHVVDLNEAYGMVENGRINNAAAIIALQWLRLNEASVREAWKGLIE